MGDLGCVASGSQGASESTEGGSARGNQEKAQVLHCGGSGKSLRALEPDPERSVEAVPGENTLQRRLMSGMDFLDFGVDLLKVNSHHVGEVTPYIFACSFVAVTMFWKFDLNTTSHVDKLLDREDVTLRELMDEDDILQECKAQNQKLLGFLCRQRCMEELVSLITQDPPLDMEEKVRFKYVLRL